MPKKSRYNHFQRWNDDYFIAYNARSGAVALMTPEHYGLYESIISKLDADKPKYTEAEKELLKKLEYGKYVCDNDYDEYAALHFSHNVARYGHSTLALVIAPTMACNMACQYCYEENKVGLMSSETIEHIIEFVKKRGKGLGNLSIGWYGGEPLLAMNIIEELSTKLIEMGEELQYEYSASIVTNGYLLTPEIVTRLRDLKTKNAQVTLDGPAEMHNMKRPLKNGKESFKTIIENLKHAVKYMSISLRVNIDQSFSAQTIEQLLLELKEAGLHERVSINFGHLEPSTEVCSNISESCYDTNSFAEVETDYFKLLLGHGFRIDKIPAPSSICCMAQVVGAFVVDPEGHLYRCWNHVGNQTMAMGNIKDDLNYQHPNFRRLFDVNPFEEDTCRECELLPICMGGCPSRRVDRGYTGEQMCESWKYNLQPMLEIIAASRQQEALKSAKEK